MSENFRNNGETPQIVDRRVFKKGDTIPVFRQDGTIDPAGWTILDIDPEGGEVKIVNVSTNEVKHYRTQYDFLFHLHLAEVGLIKNDMSEIIRQGNLEYAGVFAIMLRCHDLAQTAWSESIIAWVQRVLESTPEYMQLARARAWVKEASKRVYDIESVVRKEDNDRKNAVDIKALNEQEGLLKIKITQLVEIHRAGITKVQLWTSVSHICGQFSSPTIDASRIRIGDDVIFEIECTCTDGSEKIGICRQRTGLRNEASYVPVQICANGAKRAFPDYMIRPT